MAAPDFKPIEAVQAAAIARRYYLEDRSKKDIAEEFGISRFRVARSLVRARETGLVTIEIRLPSAIEPDLSDRLRRAFGLHHAIVVITPEESAALHRDHLGEIGASLLTEIVVEGDVLGISWGRTLNSMTAALQSLARCTVVQLTGAIGSGAVLQNSIEMGGRVPAARGRPGLSDLRAPDRRYRRGAGGDPTPATGRRSHPPVRRHHQSGRRHRLVGTARLS